VVLAACSRSPGTSSAGSPTLPSSSSSPVVQTTSPAVVQATSRTPRILESGCSDTSPCRFQAGASVVGDQGVIPGLRLTLPRGWSSTENDVGELNLVPPGHPDDRLFLWLDLAAVKSSGAGHGTTILKDVGRTPGALITWLTRNHDFLVVARPVPATIGHGIRTTTLVIWVSRSAR
jgi:hypothetical protein